MKTKALFLLAAIFLTSLVALPQGYQKSAYAVEGAFLMQDFFGQDYYGDKLDLDLLPSFHAGVNAIFPLASTIYFQPGINFARKGAQDKEDSQTDTYSLSYVEIPVHLLYRNQVGRRGGGYFMFGIGPYVAYAIKGTITSGSASVDIEFKNKIEETDPYTGAYFKAFDAGAEIYTGYETAMGVYFQVQAQMSLLNISPKDERASAGETSIRNTGYGLAVGFRF